eukprot:3273442-Amphidinium_carterae.1
MPLGSDAVHTSPDLGPIVRNKGFEGVANFWILLHQDREKTGIMVFRYRTFSDPDMWSSLIHAHYLQKRIGKEVSFETQCYATVVVVHLVVFE